jgi:hypothetical protein
MTTGGSLFRSHLEVEHSNSIYRIVDGHVKAAIHLLAYTVVAHVTHHADDFELVLHRPAIQEQSVCGLSDLRP